MFSFLLGTFFYYKRTAISSFRSVISIESTSDVEKKFWKRPVNGYCLLVGSIDFRPVVLKIYFTIITMRNAADRNVGRVHYYRFRIPIDTGGVRRENIYFNQKRHYSFAASLCRYTETFQRLKRRSATGTAAVENVTSTKCLTYPNKNHSHYVVCGVNCPRRNRIRFCFLFFCFRRRGRCK